MNSHQNRILFRKMRRKLGKSVYVIPYHGGEWRGKVIGVHRKDPCFLVRFPDVGLRRVHHKEIVCTI